MITMGEAHTTLGKREFPTMRFNVVRHSGDYRLFPVDTCCGSLLVLVTMSTFNLSCDIVECVSSQESTLSATGAR